MPSEANLSDYSTDTRGADINFGIPINEYDTVRFSVGYQGLDLNETSTSPLEVTDFIDKHGNSFDDMVLTGSWSHDSRNKILFTDTGGLQPFSFETTTPGSGLEYYKLNYDSSVLFP